MMRGECLELAVSGTLSPGLSRLHSWVSMGEKAVLLLGTRSWVGSFQALRQHLVPMSVPWDLLARWHSASGDTV